MTDIRIDEGTVRLAAAADRGEAIARATGRPVLVSVVERIEPLDPLAVALRFARSESQSIPSHPGDAGCMYWERPSARFAIAGTGSATTLSARGPGRFVAVDREWKKLMEGAVTDGPSQGAAGTGPMLMGGFSFEPDGPRTASWRGFRSAQLTLPRLLVAATADGCWLTTTIVVGPDGVRDVDLNELSAFRERVLARTDRRDGSKPLASLETVIRSADLRAPSRWRSMVASAVDTIQGGALEKVVLARAVRATGAGRFDVGAILRHLREAHPDSFVFACWRGDRAFVGASPERLVRLDGRDVLASSLAGSAERGATPEEDAWLAAQLAASPKDASEHAIVLRALRDGLAELCDGVTAAEEPSLLTLRHVHHLHTVVRARLRAGHSLLELVERLHPTPAVGGAPRDAALEFIRAHEELDRGWYAAPVGWLRRDGGEFAVALRSGLIEGDEATLYAGCGVVLDSEPDLELAESTLKLRSMMAALAAAEGASHPAPAMTDRGVAP
jgi:isochorismate synthase